VRDGRTTFVPKNWEKTYFDWLENIQPWCVSRQLWWGHRIPAWYDEDGNAYVEETEEAALAAARAKLGDGVTLTRDEDVLDTWFSSALWPFSTLGWPEKTPELARYYPTSALVTGFDIIFFWVARMMMMGLYFMDEVPFHDIYIHALVRDEKGAKMSKSKGNVIDPLRLIDEYGADALRFTLAAMAAQGRDIKLSTQRVEGYRNFATKLWNASRFAEINGCARVAHYDPRANRITLNRWIIGEAARTTADVSAAIEAYRFNDAANAVYRFVWSVFCDWYVELAKPLLQGADGAEKDETRATVAYVLDQIYALLHPFMPFLTEELWAIKGADGPKRETMLALASWPSLEGLEDAEAESEIGWVVDLISEVRSLRAEMNLTSETELLLAASNAETVGRLSLRGDRLIVPGLGYRVAVFSSEDRPRVFDADGDEINRARFERRGASARLQIPFGRWGLVEAGAAFGQVRSVAEPGLDYRDGTDDVGLLMASATADDLDDLLWPESGERLAIAAEWSLPELGATRGYWRASGEGRVGRRLGRRGTAQIDAFVGLSGDDLPVYDYFRIGGPRLVPGFHTEELQGAQAVAGGLSIRFRVVRALRVFVRAGAGNVFATRDQIDLGDLRWGVGGGAMLPSRVGPLAVEIGVRDSGKLLVTLWLGWN